MTEKNNVTVRIMERDYSVKCPSNMVHALHETAKYLSTRIREIQDKEKVFSLDNLAIVTALNITHELLIQRKQNLDYIEKMNQQINELRTIIENALEKE